MKEFAEYYLSPVATGRNAVKTFHINILKALILYKWGLNL